MSFVSRAGAKLKHSLKEFGIDIGGKTCADLGCSTGGFTDCLLQHGAAKVYAVDTGYGVLDYKLRSDPRVVMMEKTNALHLKLPETVDLVTVDVSWTPQRLIIPQAMTLLKPCGVIISLLKPQYENPRLLSHGKIPVAGLAGTLSMVEKQLHHLGILIQAITPSPLTGEKGKNVEFLMLISYAILNSCPKPPLSTR
jgi:23S rRNA (cytidine1920-2'-O)/16S rRNA (cytidine1409-2'-O)-methyltransferase